MIEENLRLGWATSTKKVVATSHVRWRELIDSGKTAMVLLTWPWNGMKFPPFLSMLDKDCDLRAVQSTKNGSHSISTFKTVNIYVHLDTAEFFPHYIIAESNRFTLFILPPFFFLLFRNPTWLHWGFRVSTFNNVELAWMLQWYCGWLGGKKHKLLQLWFWFWSLHCHHRSEWLLLWWFLAPYSWNFSASWLRYRLHRRDVQ